jgi:serine/threonine protein phosphatase PrpC
VTLVLQRGYKLYIGQLGDSKVLIGRRFKTKKTIQLEQLNNDHTPDNNEEKQRIYQKGGEIRKWTDGLDRVFVKGRVFPCLATTRSLGDDIGSFIGIESEPEIVSFDLNEQSDKFLLIGTNAVFAYLEDAEILNVVNFASADKIKETAEILVKKAVNGWKSSENTFDDMTLIFAYFPWSEPKRT